MAKKSGGAEAASPEIPCVALNLRKCSQIISRYYARSMREAPVRGPSFSLLARIQKRGSPSIKVLASDVGLDRTTLTRNLKQLERRGLIEISPVGANRKEIRLLAEGERALSVGLVHWRKTQEKVLKELGEDRWRRLRRDLEAVMELGK